MDTRPISHVIVRVYAAIDCLHLDMADRTTEPSWLGKGRWDCDGYIQRGDKTYVRLHFAARPDQVALVEERCLLRYTGRRLRTVYRRRATEAPDGQTAASSAAPA